MNSFENVRLALNSIKSNFLRSLITLMIIAIGIAALVGILTALDVLLLSLSDNFSDMGANSFNIERKYEDLKGNRKGRRAKASDPISFEQAMKFKKKYKYPVKGVSVSITGTSIATVKYQKEKSNPNVSVLGCDLDYIKMRGSKLQAGRFFNETELENGAHKTIIGSDICKLLFNNNPELALGKLIANGNVKYKVVGVMESKGSSMSSNEDRMILVPITNAVRYYDSDNRNYDLSIGVNDALQMEPAESAAIGVFRNVRGLKIGEDNDFETFKSDGIMEILKENTVTIRWATIFIGLATLCGAAIGLMNIMLVSVTERTREIGVCKALGASSNNVLLQFLTEAIVISIIGGIVGVILGLIVGALVAYSLGGNFVMPWNWISLGFGLCFVVGVISGFYPAMRASSLDPIEALRYE